MYHFYLQQTDKDGTVISGSKKDLEINFPGLSYLSCSGLETRGRPKNIHTESYAEHDGARSYHPSDNDEDVTFEATEVTLSLAFQGQNRRDVYNDFCEYVYSRRLYYWDTARHKKVWLLLNNDVDPEDDTLKGVQYIRASFKFTNLWGRSKNCSDSGETE